jgi:hypothetical protein
MPKRRAWQIHLPRPRRSTMLGGEDRLTFVPERRIVRMCAYVARVRACVSHASIHVGNRLRLSVPSHIAHLDESVERDHCAQR